MLSGQSTIPTKGKRGEYLNDYMIVFDNMKNKDTPTVKAKAV